MSKGTLNSWWLIAPLMLVALTSCSSGTDEAPGPTPEALDQITKVAIDAATAAGDEPLGAGGGDGQQKSGVRLSSFTGGASYGFYTACTGGSTIGMTLAGSAVTLDCDGQAHRVGPLALPNGVADFQVTQHSDVPSEWAVAITMK